MLYQVFKAIGRQTGEGFHLENYELIDGQLELQSLNEFDLADSASQFVGMEHSELSVRNYGQFIFIDQAKDLKPLLRLERTKECI